MTVGEGQCTLLVEKRDRNGRRHCLVGTYGFLELCVGSDTSWVFDLSQVRQRSSNVERMPLFDI